MSLPSGWVDRIFGRLSATYGQGFIRQYDGVDVNEVKAEWGRLLGGFFTAPSAVQYALDNLPADKAPNALQFRELCRRAPDDAFPNRFPALPTPTAAPVAPEVIAATKAAFERKDERGWKDWAYALKRRHESGERLTRFQIECYRNALGIEQQEVA